MSRVITILLILLSFILPKSILGVASIDESIKVSYSPNPYSTDKGKVKFTIQSNNKFILSNDYSYVIRPKGQRLDYCKNPGGIIELMPKALQAKYWGTVKPKSTSIIELEWSPDESINAVCSTFYGVWTFGIWLGDSPDRIKAGNVIVGGYDFVVEQPGGGIPELRPFEDPIVAGTTPMAILINARKGNHYSFWWEGTNIRSIVKDFRAPENGNFVIDLNSNNSNTQDVMNEKRPPKICAEIGSHGTAIGLTCRYSTYFRFVATPPKYTQTCSLIPDPPRENDTAGLQAIGLDPNQDYKGELVSKGREIDPDTGLSTGDEKEYTQPLDTVKSNANGSLLITLKSLLPKGFEATVNLKQVSTNKQICSVPFSIVDKNALRFGALSPAGKICTADVPDPDCTTSAGEEKDKCTNDPSNPGISTAIGCVHTRPDVFVKDFMTFIIGIGGGLAFLMMLIGAFQMLTSAGNPDSLKAGQDRLTSAVIGLLFVMFAVLLLQIIGVDILHLPELGK